MKKYLLLASVAGCLLAHNAMAWDSVLNETSPYATLQASVRVMRSFFAWTYNINFGTMSLSESAEDGDLLATFTNGVLSVEAEKVSFHEGGSSGMVSLSGGGTESTGLNFASETIELKNTSNETVMEVYDLARGGHKVDSEYPDYWINAKLRLKDRSKLLGNGTLTGTTTVTLAF